MERISGTILIVDDDPDIREILRDALQSLGAKIIAAANGQECLDRLNQAAPDLVLLDIEMPIKNGLDVLRELRQRGCEAPVIMVTAYGTVERAVQAMKEGAYDFITKPFDLDHIALTVEKALERERLKRGLDHFATETSERYRMISGESPKMREAIDTAKKAAASKSTVLLLGESGTGKEVFARAIHHWSDRGSEPFIAINCVGLAKEILESELFGHEKGSFTDATARRVGQFELANSGTLFLDEIGDLTPLTQAKLLRVLQEREFTRIGGIQPIKVDVRIVAATNKNLDELVRKGQFREDLYYRINVISLYLPPLRERGEDIPLLAKHFLAKRIEEENRSYIEFGKDALEMLTRYPWPGNVRELENIIEQAFIWSQNASQILPEHLPMILKNDSRPSSLRDDTLAGRMSLEKAVMEFEREILLDALKRTNYVQTHAANLLGISRRMLKYRMDTLGIGRPDNAANPEPEPAVQE